MYRRLLFYQDPGEGCGGGLNFACFVVRIRSIREKICDICRKMREGRRPLLAVFLSFLTDAFVKRTF